MIGVEKILFDLLLNHDCVSLSGFGGLVAQRFRAEINPGTNIVRPPSKRISFHEGLTANNHLVIHALAEKNGLSTEAAQANITQTIKNWQLDLASGNSIKLPGIGRFYLDKNGVVCFNQSLESNFDLDAYGLEIFRATAIKRETAAAETVVAKLSEKLKAERNAGMAYWQAAAVFTGIGALLTVSFFKTDFNLQEKLRANFNPMHFSRSIAVPVQSAKVLPVAVNEPKTEAPETINYTDAFASQTEAKPATQTPAVTEILPTAQPSFHVVIGSFKDAANAQSLVNQLKSQGFPAYIVNDGSSFKKVSIQGFEKRQDAEAGLALYKGQVHKSAWVYTHN